MPARKPRPTSPRIAPVTEPSDLQRELMFGNDASDSLNISATLAHNTRVLKRFSQFGGGLLFRGVLPVRERELVILRVGANCQSVYEFGQHTLIGREAGLTDDEIHQLTLAPEKGGWSDADRDLVALADELCADDCVSDATWARLAGRWDDAALVELLAVAGFYRLVSGFLNSAGVQLDPGVPSWPEGAFEH
ncbi:MAG: carboxymuconolactone decarboxylase family protein [Acidimicrobiia bacterium]|nr:carboxymuconolactone decarboxylase family protein [Acidimicrobiia bacterium]